MARTLIIIGVLFLLLGFGWPYMEKLGLGKLPGDIMVKGENTTFYFPIVTCIVISVVLSIVFRFFNK